MVVKNPKFEVSAVSAKQYPTNGLPEIVLVGKSNVGKSSFINTMINRKSLARTSSEPGKTRQINFYNIDDKFYFVDLPGYGYSKMSKQEQEKVGRFTEEYLVKRNTIRMIIFLVDIRHKPTENDLHMYNYVMSSNLPFMVLANKADKIAPTKVEAYVEDLKKEFGISFSTLLPFSSEKKIYSEAVWKEIEKIL
ncbi:MAG: YihA family ribosome biogenesis GTP-binding protein [Clostridia bacterium]|nr:YihA family ribosome biogenesis GTP-binding protein [Clostridia bacterium]